VQRAVLHVEGDYTNTFTTFHDQVKSEILDEEVGVVAKGLAIQSVEDGMPGAISSSSTPIRLSTLAIFERLSTKSPLVDFTLVCSREGDAIVFELERKTRLTTIGDQKAKARQNTSITVLGASLHM
jgi:hypothetical protein